MLKTQLSPEPVKKIFYRPSVLSPPSGASEDLQFQLKLAQLRKEKCDLADARRILNHVLDTAHQIGDHRAFMEAAAGLLRLAAEAQDLERIRVLQRDLFEWMKKFPDHVPPTAWYCLASVAYLECDYPKTLSLLNHYLHKTKLEKMEGDRPSDAWIRGWLFVANTLVNIGKHGRAEVIARYFLPKLEGEALKTYVGHFSLTLGRIYFLRGDWDESERWYQQAHECFLVVHHWYYFLYSLLGFARVACARHDFGKARWYIGLLDGAAKAPELAILRRETDLVRVEIDDAAVDLYIDSTRGVIKTREGESVSLRKQFILLHILENLASSHLRGLSKLEIIEKVWKEKYRPELHDNKLYYNINRLRKLIEPDMRQPRYLMNWKAGYRLAPGLKIRWIKDRKDLSLGER